MGLVPGTPLAEITVDRVFIGSCTNSRIEDLRAAAAVARGRKVVRDRTGLGGAGLGPIKAQAEAEGLDRIFTEAGFEWRQAGCSMCLGTNGEIVAPGQRCASTSNRNFVGRQGPGARTHLMSPAMAAAAAVTGHLTDVRQLTAGGGAWNPVPDARRGRGADRALNIDTDQIIPARIPQPRARRRARRQPVPRPALCQGWAEIPSSS